MARTRLDPRRARKNRSYSVEQVADLFDVHRNTVRNWIVRDGLPTIDDRRPILVHGPALRAFLEARREAAKRPTTPGTIFCLRCRQARAPALGMADFVPTEGAGAGDLHAVCEACGAFMHRRTRADTLEAVMPGIEVRVRGAVPHIPGSPSPSLNCASKKDRRP